jgi:hypothetical protein
MIDDQNSETAKTNDTSELEFTDTPLDECRRIASEALEVAAERIAIKQTFSVSDPDEIRPIRPILKSEIINVLNLHAEMLDLRRMALNRAFDIGFKLRCWHDLIPHGKWTKWCEANIPQIHERTIRRYLQLWDNHELIRTHFKSDTVSDLDEVIGIKEALEFLKESNPAPAKEKRANSTTVSNAAATESARPIPYQTREYTTRIPAIGYVQEPEPDKGKPS